MLLAVVYKMLDRFGHVKQSDRKIGMRSKSQRWGIDLRARRLEV
jgi:hypothetical protein